MQNDRIEVMLEEYKTLREEILYCLKTQHDIYIAEGAAVFGAVIGIVALADSNFGNVINYILLGAPLIFIIFTSLWITEQSRMMRAGNYIEMLENEINNEYRKTHLGEDLALFWENSLRINRPRFSQEHYISQLIGIFGSYLVVSTFSIGMIWKNKFVSGNPFIILFVFYLFFFILILYLIVRILTHKATKIEDFLESRKIYNNKLNLYKAYEIKTYEQSTSSEKVKE